MKAIGEAARQHQRRAAWRRAAPRCAATSPPRQAAEEVADLLDPVALPREADGRAAMRSAFANVRMGTDIADVRRAVRGHPPQQRRPAASTSAMSGTR